MASTGIRIHVTLESDQPEKFLQLARAVVAETRKEKGCILYEVSYCYYYKLLSHART